MKSRVISNSMQRAHKGPPIGKSVRKICPQNLLSARSVRKICPQNPVRNLDVRKGKFVMTLITRGGYSGLTRCKNLENHDFFDCRLIAMHWAPFAIAMATAATGQA